MFIYCKFRYVDVTKSQNKNDNTTIFHHYRIDVLNVATGCNRPTSDRGKRSVGVRATTFSA